MAPMLSTGTNVPGQTAPHLAFFMIREQLARFGTASSPAPGEPHGIVSDRHDPRRRFHDHN